MSMKTVVVSVLGLSRAVGELFQSGEEGAGKSCLCYRFMHPNFDDYVSDHSSILALHEFESPSINNDHFVYWGSKKQSYTNRGKEHSLLMHVVEHTIFYQDVTSTPFNVHTKPDDVTVYARKAVGSIESSGKTSYMTRDALCLSETFSAENYPRKISGVTRGFMVVVDTSLYGVRFESQFQRAEMICHRLAKSKRKFILVSTKQDQVVAVSLEKLRGLRRKHNAILVETSASCNYNIDVTFRVIAGAVLGEGKLSDDVPSYLQAAQNLLSAKASAKRLFRGFIGNRVQVSCERLKSLSETEQYQNCMAVVGKFESDKLIALRLLEVRNKEVGSYYGVSENREMRQEFLEEFLDERQDLKIYSKDLNRSAEKEKEREKDPSVNGLSENLSRYEREKEKRGYIG